MVYLKRLANPVPLNDGSTLDYYGIARDMEVLEPYFDCAAYEGSSGVYVVDGEGLTSCSAAAAPATTPAVPSSRATTSTTCWRPWSTATAAL